MVFLKTEKSLPLYLDAQELNYDHFDQYQVHLSTQPEFLTINKQQGGFHHPQHYLVSITSAYSKGLTDCRGILVGRYWFP